jgi:hypothetical protein
LDLDFNEVTGMRSDGATKWLDIKFKPSDLSATQNGGFGVVVGGANATTDPWVIGMTNNTTQIYGLKLDDDSSSCSSGETADQTRGRGRPLDRSTTTGSELHRRFARCTKAAA